MALSASFREALEPCGGVGSGLSEIHIFPGKPGVEVWVLRQRRPGAGISRPHRIWLS